MPHFFSITLRVHSRLERECTSYLHRARSQLSRMRIGTPPRAAQLLRIQFSARALRENPREARGSGDTAEQICYTRWREPDFVAVARRADWQTLRQYLRSRELA